MAHTRRATAEDAEAIAHQRHRMFVDSGQADDASMPVLIASFIPWVRSRLEDGNYVGWLTEDDGQLVAGAGLWIMDFPPHFLDTAPRRAYLLNFYVDPAMRGRGLARDLLTRAIDHARSMGIKVISLHASKFGRPLYQQNGFTDSNEMMLRLT